MTLFSICVSHPHMHPNSRSCQHRKPIKFRVPILKGPPPSLLACVRKQHICACQLCEMKIPKESLMWLLLWSEFLRIYSKYMKGNTETHEITSRKSNSLLSVSVHVSWCKFMYSTCVLVGDRQNTQPPLINKISSGGTKNRGFAHCVQCQSKEGVTVMTAPGCGSDHRCLFVSSSSKLGHGDNRSTRGGESKENIKLE